MTEERLHQGDVRCRLLFPKGMQDPCGTPGTQACSFWPNTCEEEQSRMMPKCRTDIGHSPHFLLLEEGAVFPPCGTDMGLLQCAENKDRGTGGNSTLSQSSALQHPEALEPGEQNSVPAVATELHGLGMQPWDALLDSPPLEMGEDDPFVANQRLALCVRPVLPPRLQLLLSRAKSLLQVLEEAQVPLSLCQEPCSHWSVCFHVSFWMFRLNLHFEVPQLCLFSGKCSLEEGSM